ncbi:hypothetical protein A3J90_03625 [candidate division WOR-1 bacterium RIFOXYC2_FULL_37_10]|uniref:Uncharacterized protein n=1 Tax=candidate division WOR-1 bacterium RIFOXYB2_FULL_37_13 TaxID=1802579 RepID=A0A1F4SG98_UNCSA|nr:MAG: hypothetical protein A2246_01390 [candidate division WOR-1 bacterium RIFOXYA2_FULL_37_7]OGC18753.1 MAG: hypothetical protein A2310_02555 [candidate division WOR-1 bacterium RIFOXYB2_FULL_37_13]OGC32654.1 MAG: hypothetical protein A3J90_03625 [candidate division WOR-1 bacterium RIFOXYC2_FULL_37_10]
MKDIHPVGARFRPGTDYAQLRLNRNAKPTTTGDFQYLKTRITLNNAHQYFDNLFHAIEVDGIDELDSFGNMLEEQNVSGELFQGIAYIFAERLIDHIEAEPTTAGVGLFLHAIKISSDDEQFDNKKTRALLQDIALQQGIQTLQDAQKLFDETWKEIENEEDKRNPLSVMLALNKVEDPLVKGYALSMICHKIDNPKVEGAILGMVLFGDSSEVKTEEDRQAIVQLATQWRLRSLDSWSKDKDKIKEVGIVLKEATSEELTTTEEEKKDYEAQLEEIKTLREDAYKITDSDARFEKSAAIRKQETEAKLLEDAFFAHRDSLSYIIASVFKELFLEFRDGHLLINTIANPDNRWGTPWDSLVNLAYNEMTREG